MKYFFSLLLIICLSWTTTAQDHQQEVIDFQEELNSDYKYGIKSPLSEMEREHFEGHDFFPIDEKYRVVANFEKVDNAVPFFMKTTTSRMPSYQIFGTATFTLNGKEHRLNLYQSEDPSPGYENMLFLPFTDETTGEESYSVGRYMDIEIPQGDTVVIDFNKSYNPYCAYSGRYSCPIPPEENNLKTAIKAGIKAPH